METVWFSTVSTRRWLLHAKTWNKRTTHQQKISSEVGQTWSGKWYICDAKYKRFMCKQPQLWIWEELNAQRRRKTHHNIESYSRMPAEISAALNRGRQPVPGGCDRSSILYHDVFLVLLLFCAFKFPTPSQCACSDGSWTRFTFIRHVTSP